MGAGLNQPSSVQDDGPTGCKLLLYGNKVRHLWRFACTVMNKDRLIPCQQPR